MKDWESPIPRIIHLIWIGNNPYPDYFNLFIKSFKKNLPEFEIRIWGNKSLNKKFFLKLMIIYKKPKKFMVRICLISQIIKCLILKMVVL